MWSCRETRMSKAAILLSTLVLGVTAVVAGPVITTADAKNYHHASQKHRHWRHANGSQVYVAGPAVAPAYQVSEPICPQVGHSFDCKIWPPPYADDPDRKTSKH